ncbi:MAG: tetratricopeptide repeat protein [Geminicoccaceae bacterium]|nr:tetratricopeptide repeat protein [Geminicoccaceae bacterium]
MTDNPLNRISAPVSALCRVVAIAVLMFIALPGMAPAVQAAEPTIRIGQHADFTRLAIEWPDPIEARWTNGNRELRLQISRPVPLEIMQTWRRLDGLVTTASLSRDRLSLQIGLKASVTTRTSVIDRNILAIDFITDRPPANSRTTNTGTMRLRLGEHETFLRVVLEPFMPGDGSIRDNQGHITVPLPGLLPREELARLAKFRKLISDAHVEGSTLSLQLAHPGPVRTMNVDGDKLVIDIPMTTTVEAARQHAPDTHQRASGTATHGTGHDVPPPTPVPAPRGHGGDTHGTRDPRTSSSSNEQSASAQAVTGEAKPDEEHPQTDTTRDHGGISDAGHGVTSDAHSASGEADGHDLTLSHGSQSTSRDHRPPQEDLAQIDRSVLVRRVSSKIPHFAELPVVAAPRDNGVELRFLWPEPVAAAVFQRAGYLWVGFHARVDSVTADREAMQRYATSYIRSIRQEPQADSTIFRFAMTGRSMPRVVRDGPGWIVQFGSGSPPPEQPGLLRVGPNPALVLEDSEGAVTMADPTVGDMLGIAFFDQPGIGIGRSRELVNLAFLPAIQGAVWSVKSPDLETIPIERGLLIDRPEGLRLGNWPSAAAMARHDDTTGEGATGDHAAATHDDAGLGENASIPDTGHMAAAAQHDDAPPGGHHVPSSPDLKVAADKLLDLGSVDVKVPSTLWQQKRELLPALVSGDAPHRFMAHVRMARLYLANGLGREARTYVDRARDILAEVAPDSRDDASKVLDALQAVADLQDGDLDEARGELAADDLAEDPEIALWRAVMSIRDDGPVPADLTEKQLLQTLKTYGPPMRARLGIDLIRAYLDEGKADPAFVLIDHLDRQPMTPENEAPFRLAQAMAFERDGDNERALSYLEQARESARMPVALDVSFDITELMRKLDKITVDQAIAALKPERPLWRGQKDESKYLRRYGRLLAEGNRAEEALEVWQIAAERAPSPEMARVISEDMGVLFADILAGRDGWKRTPLQALAIYRRYRELLPTGKVGNDLINRLAEEVDGIGLHNVAAAMLDRQATFRLDEIMDRGPIRLQAARMHLAAGDAEAALKILRSDAMEALGTVGQAQRDRMIAEALRDLGRGTELDQTLAQRNEPWARALRIDEAFATGNAPVVISEAHAYLADMGQETPIRGEAARIVLRLAMTLAQRNDRQAMTELEGQYSTRMSDAEDKALLALITQSPPDRGKSKEVVALSGEFVDETRKLLNDVENHDALTQ